MILKKVIYYLLPTGITTILRNRKRKNNINNSLLENTISLQLKEFGALNPDKYFYVIRGFGAGMFSNLQYVLANIRQAEIHGMIPVVDFENFYTVYKEPYAINNTNNAWNYFFKNVSKYTLEEVYKSKNVFINSGEYNWDMGYYFSDKNLYDYYTRYISFSDDIYTQYLKYKKELFSDKRILGIQFRGWEMNSAAGHPFCPTIKQMFDNTDEILTKYNIDYIYLATEQEEYFDAYVKKYGDKIISTPYFRTKKHINGYKITPEPRRNHLYLMGKDIIINALLLADCNGLLHCGTNVSTFAKFHNHGNYEFEYSIFNGVNSSNSWIAKILFDVKKIFPLGSKFGLENKITVIEN